MMTEQKNSGDRIWQMYDGAFGTVAQRQARERIHWICAQAKPRRVLDIGCSQGVSSVLLAREGMWVTGIDLDAHAIAYANDRAAAESSATRERVKFIVKDFMDFSEQETYDTILLTEVLEHLLNPDQFLKKAARLLKPDGRLIVSVPFGINDWPDHKRTYYLSQLLRQLTAYFTADEVRFFSQWVACTATHPGVGKGICIDLDLLEREERAFFEMERPLRDRQKELMQETQALHTQLQEQMKRCDVLLNERNAAQAERDTIQRQRDSVQNERDALRQSIQHIQKSCSELKELLLKEQKTNQSLDLQRKHSMTDAAGWKRQYDLLAASKLGRIQIHIWKRRSEKIRRKQHKPSFISRIKTFAKRSPLLVAIVRRLRGEKASIKQAADERKSVKAKQSAHADAYDMGYYERIRQMVEQLPCSNGSRYYKKLKPKIGWITDEILYDAFKSAADGILLTPENWEQSLNEIDWLFIISGWHGIDKEWNGFARADSAARQTIYKIIAACRARQLPTVFYSVEDPPNYERFIGIAQKCDYVFTAAVEMLPRYRQDCGHDRVYQLCYGIDPLLHNPVGFRKFPKQPEVFFAGSWMDKYPERGRDLQILFDGVLKSGRALKIVDRNLLLDQEEYRFPNQYSRYLSPPLEHGVLQRIHKLYDWAININSVKQSATMFANRTYELQAMGSLMISNYSVGVNSLLPTIFTCQHSEEIPHILNAFTPEELYEHQVMGIRFAMHGNTCFERVAQILNTAGIPAQLPCYQAAVVMDAENARLLDAFHRQSYPNKHIVSPEQLRARWEEFDLIAWFSPEAEYGDFYLEDMINGFKYTDSDYITKAGYLCGTQYIPGTEHDYVDVMPGRHRTVFWRRSFTADALLAMDGAVPLCNGYSIDHFEFNARPAEPATEPAQYAISVIVPVYNNGLHLYGKAFNSLRRSSIFDKMEILLVDDGSTDAYTGCIVRSLAARYPNVKAFFFDDGGSGSASRPRNKGVELARGEHITFLDPDNEAVNDAYARMLEIALAEGDDIVVGNMGRFRLNEELANYHYYFTKRYGSDLVEGDKDDFLRKIAFTPMSIQAMVIRKAIITQSGIFQVVGAVGQDSFFSWQLFTSAGRIRSVDIVAHLYYAMVQHSTVNSVTEKYFQRSLLQEQVQQRWLEERGLLKDYMQQRFIGFFRDWYLKKLEQADPAREAACAQILWQIFQLYAPGYDGCDAQINAFVQRMQA